MSHDAMPPFDSAFRPRSPSLRMPPRGLHGPPGAIAARPGWKPGRAGGAGCPWGSITPLGWLLVFVGLWVSGCAGPSQDILTLPVEQPSVSAPGALTHTVRPQETLWSISQRYQVPYRAIMRANGLTDAARVPVGATLVIPQPALPPVRIPLYPNPRWTHLVIHHSATASGSASFLDRAHRKQGFTNGLGYHFVIDNGTLRRRDGQLEVGPRWLKQREGAHCNAGGMNDHGIGICLVGDFTTHPPSTAQLDALVALVEQLRAYYRIPSARVIRHRDVPGKNTACPGDRFPWSAFKSRLASLP